MQTPVKDRFVVHSLRIANTMSKEEAKLWCSNHGYKPKESVDEPGHHVFLMQKPKPDAELISFALPLERGVEVCMRRDQVVAKPEKKEADAPPKKKPMMVIVIKEAPDGSRQQIYKELTEIQYVDQVIA